MSLCINPHCSHPDNLDDLMECQSCGSDLLIEGNYKVIKLLKDDGGYGKIYDIKDLSDNNSKILKILTKNDSKSIELFKTEFEILSKLNHPGIPKAEENKKSQLKSNINPFTNLRNFQFKTTLGDIASRHLTPINSIAISPDGGFLVSGSEGGNVRIWSLKSNQAIFSLSDHYETVTSVDISADGNTFATGGLDSKVYIYSIEKINEINFQVSKICNFSNFQISLFRLLPRNIDSTNAVKFQPSVRRLICGCGDNSIRIWNLDSAKLIRRIHSHKEPIKSIAVSKDGKLVASGGMDKKIIVHFEHIFEGHAEPVYSVIISHDNQKLFSGSGDGEIKIWNLNNGELINTLTEHDDAVLSLVLSPDGQTLFSGSKDQTIKIWDINNMEENYTLERHLDAVTSLAITPDGKTLISASYDKSIKLWQLNENC